MNTVIVWRDGREGLADATEVERLASLHSLWRRDMERWAPWRPEMLKGLGRVLVAGGPSCARDRVLLTLNCSSAMDVAWTLWTESALAPWDSVVAGHQWAGRGQLGRSWVSAAGNLLSAWLLPSWEGSFPISLLLGYAVVLTLREWGVEARIKWPNDVWIRGFKVAGILCEQRENRVVVGVGLNVASHPAREDLREDVDVEATSLASWGVRVSPLSVWERIQHHARELMKPSRMAGLSREIEVYLMFLGEMVRVSRAGEESYLARVCRLDPSGALWVDRGGRLDRIESGSIATLERKQRMRG